MVSILFLRHWESWSRLHSISPSTTYLIQRQFLTRTPQLRRGRSRHIPTGTREVRPVVDESLLLTFGRIRLLQTTIVGMLILHLLLIPGTSFLTGVISPLDKMTSDLVQEEPG
jgi:hypothetical protein